MKVLISLFSAILTCYDLVNTLSRGVKLAARDSKILNKFRQYCNVSSSKKRLNPLTQATLERYRLFFIWRSTPLRATELDF